MNNLKSKFLASCVGTAVGDQFGAGDKGYTDDTVKIMASKKLK
jgi:hypothetical protein